MMSPNDTVEQNEQCIGRLDDVQEQDCQRPETVRVGSVRELTQGIIGRYIDSVGAGWWG
jgi:hypothetical protein